MSDETMSVPVERRLTLTIPAAAAVAGLPEKVVRRAVADGSLGSFTIGSTTRRIKRAELDDWIASL